MDSSLTHDTSPSPKLTTYIPGPIIVGAGPSGLAAAACLADAGIPFTVLEKSDSLASLWRHRSYDRLSLHLPKQFCQLPLMEFPKHFPKYPSKEQFISYVESYAAAYGINPRFGCAVEHAEFDSNAGGWRVEFLTRWLVVATGENAVQVVPEFPGLPNFSGGIIHSSEYKSGAVYAGKKILVVGCGNSGMEISLDLCRHNARPSIVVRNNVHVLPREIMGCSTFGIAVGLLKWLPLRVVDGILLFMAHLVLGDTGSVGLRRSKTGPLELKDLTGKTPVMDVGALSLIKSGKIKVTEGVREITGDGAKFVDGKEEQFDAVIFATGYKSNVPSWLQVIASHTYYIRALLLSFFFSSEGMPKTPFPNGWKGEKGLYSVGFTRRGLLGTSFDARNIARDIKHCWKLASSPT
ncbi:putative indole-3-pyruvate monooxygenase YUCCA4 [Platanthera guangdongensis]|uniref:Flavin-containing monooxygenase n=1 Tax=Platanthera guangdongensis TaxID=2320717 RepID=A0ABR2M2X8_9ASPA